MDDQDVGMIERARSLGLLLKSRQAILVGGKANWQES